MSAERFPKNYDEASDIEDFRDLVLLDLKTQRKNILKIQRMTMVSTFTALLSFFMASIALIAMVINS